MYHESVYEKSINVTPNFIVKYYLFLYHFSYVILICYYLKMYSKKKKTIIFTATIRTVCFYSCTVKKRFIENLKSTQFTAIPIYNLQLLYTFFVYIYNVYDSKLMRHCSFLKVKHDVNWMLHYTLGGL